MDNLLHHFEKLGAEAQREKKIEEVIEPSSTEEEEEVEEGADALVLRTPPQRLILASSQHPESPRHCRT